MTLALSGNEVAATLEQVFPGSIIESKDDIVVVKSESLLEVISYLNKEPEYDFDYLSGITAVDYLDYFDVVYHLVSMTKNQSMVVKTRCYGRENLTVPSICEIYRGANTQEREVYDLMGITFTGHPDLKRLLLWDGFQGHPLRKDFLK